MGAIANRGQDAFGEFVIDVGDALGRLGLALLLDDGVFVDDVVRVVLARLAGLGPCEVADVLMGGSDNGAMSGVLFRAYVAFEDECRIDFGRLHGVPPASARGAVFRQCVKAVLDVARRRGLSILGMLFFRAAEACARRAAERARKGGDGGR